MTTTRFYIAASKLNSFYNFVKKVQKHCDINVKVSEVMEKVFVHKISDGITSERVKRVHEVVEVTISLPDINNWELIASYTKKNGFVPASFDKEIVYTNPLHGENYHICDECGHKIYNSYVVRNVLTGEEKQVGSECLKSFCVDRIVYLSKFTAELYRNYVISYMKEEWEWTGNACPAEEGIGVKETEKVFDSIALYYKDNKVWKKGYWNDKVKQYFKSESQVMIMNFVRENKSSKIEGLFEAVKTYVDALEDSDFISKVKKVYNQFYCTEKDIIYLFYGLKMYEDTQNNVFEGLNEDMPVRVEGKIISKKSVETIFGTKEVVLIKTKDNVVERLGKVDGRVDEEVSFYTTIKRLDKKTNRIVVNRTLKNAKKGIEYKMI